MTTTTVLIRRWLCFAIVFAWLASADDAGGNFTIPESYRSGNDQAKMLKEAVELWKKNERIPGREQCHMEYFDALDEDNIDASDVFEWYNQELQLAIKKDRNEYKQFGETVFFGRKMLGNADLGCTILNNGCIEKPRSCHTVVDHVRSTEPDLPLDAALEKGRRLYFMAKKIDQLFKVHVQLDKLLSNTQISLSEEAANIVNEYTTHPDRRAEIACSWIKTAIDITVDALAASLSICAGAVFFKAVVNEVKKKTCDKIVPAVIGYATGTTDNLGYAGDETEKLLKSKLRGNDDTHGDLHMTQSYLSGVCSLVGGGMKNEDWQRYSDMESHIRDTFSTMRSNFESLVNLITRYNDPDVEYSPLAIVLSGLDYNHVVKKITGGTAKFEDVMLDRFTEKYISYSYASSHCSVVCTYADNAVEQKKYCTQSWWNWGSRYCPEDTEEHKNVACQGACWTTKDLDNRWHELLGQKSLEHKGMNVSYVVKKSWENFVKDGTGGVSASGLVSDFSHLDAILSSNNSAIDFPVCISSYIDIHNYDKALMSGGTAPAGRNLNQNFPCTCGGRDSEGTRRYFERLGFAPGQTDWVNHRNHELIETICPWNLQYLSPYVHFMAFCQLGLRHPQYSDKDNDFRMDRGTNKYCEAILAETRGMTDRNATRHFCHHSPYAQQVFREERGWGSKLTGFKSKSHSESCKDWQGAIWVSNDTSMPRWWEDKFRKLKPPPGFVVPKWNQTQFDLENPHFNITDFNTTVPNRNQTQFDLDNFNITDFNTTSSETSKPVNPSSV